MYKVDFPELAPSVCFVCESAPPELPMVDTGRNYDPAGTTHLGPGRKYLCLSCIRDTAAVVGLLDDVKAPLVDVIETLEEEVASLTEQIKAYDTLQAALDAFVTREPEAAPAPKPSRKPRAQKKEAAVDAKVEVPADAEASADAATTPVPEDGVSGDE